MPPDHDPPAPDGIEIEIDPELIEAALRAVEHPGAREPVEAPPRPPVDQAAALRERDERLHRLEAELRREIEGRQTVEAQARELREALRATQADFERYRARARRDAEEAARKSEEKVLLHLLETADNLERALGHVGRAEETDLATGLAMVVDQVRHVMRVAGLEPVVATPGTPFDPEVHEAVQHVPDDALPEGSIVDEHITGYRLRGRLLRAARVSVAAPAPGGTD